MEARLALAAALIALVALAGIAAAAHAAPPAGRGGGHGGQRGAPGGAAPGHGNATRAQRTYVNQTIEPSVVETGEEFNVTIVLVGNETVRVVEVLPPWLRVTVAEGNVTIHEGVVPAELLSKCGCLRYLNATQHRLGNATRAARGAAHGNATSQRVEERVRVETRYWGVAELYMANATVVEAVLTPAAPEARITVMVAYPPPSRVTVLHGVAILPDGSRAPIRGDTRLVVVDSAGCNVTVENGTIRVEARLRLRTRLALALIPGAPRIEVVVNASGLAAAPPVTVYTLAFNQSGYYNATLSIALRAGGQELNVTIPRGARAACCIDYVPVNEAPAQPPGEPLLVFELGPSHDFGAEVHVSLRLGVYVANATVYYWDGSAWRPLPTRVASPTEGIVEFNTTHFTIFAVVAGRCTSGEEATQSTTTTTSTASTTETATPASTATSTTPSTETAAATTTTTIASSTTATVVSGTTSTTTTTAATTSSAATPATSAATQVTVEGGAESYATTTSASSAVVAATGTTSAYTESPSASSTASESTASTAATPGGELYVAVAALTAIGVALALAVRR